MVSFTARITFLFTVVFNIVFLVGCLPEKDEENGNNLIEVPSGQVVIYKNTGGKQCENSGQTVEQSAQFLINNGIDVVISHCGTLTGIAVPSVCGGQTLNINLHVIHEQNSLDSKNLGYGLVSEMDTGHGMSYQILKCN